MENPKIAVIIGAGPAGLTAAYELLTKTHIKPIVIEQNENMGGLSKTVVYKGNRIDIGGHRFFFKIGTGDGMVAEYFTLARASGLRNHDISRTKQKN